MSMGMDVGMQMVIAMCRTTLSTTTMNDMLCLVPGTGKPSGIVSAMLRNSSAGYFHDYNNLSLNDKGDGGGDGGVCYSENTVHSSNFGSWHGNGQGRGTDYGGEA
jgi:hypothetical protein